MSKPTLYVFGFSVWAAVPELAVAELYPEDAIELKVVNLVEGENFAPSFLEKNPAATIPVLEVDGKTYRTTAEVTSYLVKNAPIKVKEGTDTLIQLVHEDKYDPNFALLLSRNEEERKAKASGIPGGFLAGRQAALEKYAATPEGAPFKAFYYAKIAGNGGLNAIYQGKAPDTAVQGFFAQSQAHFNNISSFVNDILPGYLPTNGFIGGDRPGEDDFHVGAWLTRIGATSGAEKGEDVLKSFETAFGKAVPEKVASYFNAWFVRPSWKKVYAAALH